MKITNEQLRQIIKEELEYVLSEDTQQYQTYYGKGNSEEPYHVKNPVIGAPAELSQNQRHQADYGNQNKLDQQIKNRMAKYQPSEPSLKDKAFREKQQQSANFQAYLRDVLNDPILGATLDYLNLGNQAEAKYAVKEVMLELGLGNTTEATTEEIEKIRNALRTKNRSWWQKTWSWMKGQGYKQ